VGTPDGRTQSASAVEARIAAFGFQDLSFRTSIFAYQDLGFRTSIFASQDLGFRTSIFASQVLGFRTSIFGSQDLGFTTSIFISQDLGFRTSIFAFQDLGFRTLINGHWVSLSGPGFQDLDRRTDIGRRKLSILRSFYFFLVTFLCVHRHFYFSRHFSLRPPSLFSASNGHRQTHQRSIYDNVIDAVHDPRPLDKTFFVDGLGGASKTFLYGCLLNRVHSTGDITLLMASFGIEALLLEGGCTIHSLFKIPVTGFCGSSACYVPLNSAQAALIRVACLIMWDEAPMAHKHVFEAMNHTL
jgi:hypothetical protein